MQSEYQYFVVQDMKDSTYNEAQCDTTLKTQCGKFNQSKHNDKGLSLSLRTALFSRMQEEGLLSRVMHSYHCPSLAHWLELTHKDKGWLLCCMHKDDTPPRENFSHVEGSKAVRNIRGMAIISPIRGRLWSFDFTVFRAHFPEAVPMSLGALQWIFAHAPCDVLLGLCAKSNRHAWRLAQGAGFTHIADIPNACYIAQKKRYEDGVLVMAKAERESASSQREEILLT